MKDKKQELQDVLDYKYNYYNDVIKAFLNNDINQDDYTKDGYIKITCVPSLYEAVAFASFLQDLGIKTKVNLSCGIYSGTYFSDKPMTFKSVGIDDKPYSITSDEIYSQNFAQYVAPIVISYYIKLFGFSEKDYKAFFGTRDKLIDYVCDPEKRTATNDKLAALSIKNLIIRNQELQNEISENNKWLQYLQTQISTGNMNTATGEDTRKM